MDNLLAEGKAVPMLIVMANGMVMEEDGDGEAVLRHSLFPEELVQDIIPFIEKKYRVKRTGTTGRWPGFPWDPCRQA